MNFFTYAHKIKFYVLKFIQLQLFITLFSLPILVAWGLPFSLLSPLGNLLFGPVLTIFLFLSSLLFFTELCYIPNQFLAYLLNVVTSWWLSVMYADTHRWLIAFHKPSTLSMIMLVAAACIVMLHKKISSLYPSIGALTVLCVVFYWHTHSHVAQQPAQHVPIPCNKGHVHLFVINDQLIVLDPGFIGQRLSAPSWVRYTLIPHIHKITGTTTIDHLVMLKPNGMSFEAAAQVCAKMSVKNLHVVYWQGEIGKSALKRYGMLKRATELHQTTLWRLSNKQATLYHAGGTTIELAPAQKKVKNQTISYPVFALRACIDKQDITIYSAPYTKNNSTGSRQQTINI